MDQVEPVIGLASVAFWGFVAACVIASYWNTIKKREAQHETLRRAIETGKEIDAALIDKLLQLSDGRDGRADRDLRLTAYWILPVSPAIAAFGLILGYLEKDVIYPLLGVSALLLVLGLGYLAASFFVSKWYETEE